MGINFAPSGDQAYQGPRAGDGVTYFGYDGAAPFIIETVEIQSKDGPRGPVGQYQIDLVATDMDGVTDVNGDPVNGQSLRVWAEFSGQSKDGKPHGWKIKDILVAAGLYTVEQMQAVEQAAAQNDPQWANADENTYAQQLKGRKIHYTFGTTTTTQGSTATQADLPITPEQYEKMKSVQYPGGGTRAWHPAKVVTREERIAAQKNKGAGAPPPSNMTPGGVATLPGMGGPNGAAPGATNLPGGTAASPLASMMGS